MENASETIRVDVPESRWEEFEHLLSERNVTNTLIRVGVWGWRYEVRTDPERADIIIALLQAYQRRQIVSSLTTH